MARTLPDLVAAPDIRLADIRAHLDGLTPAARVVETRALSPRQVGRLYELAEGGGALAADDMVRGAPDGAPVRWHGTNSLPLFRPFEKRFRRHDGAVVGYNHNWHGFASGAGYFTCVASTDPRGPLLLDYTRVPATAPAGWPAPHSNARGLSYVIFRDLHDYVRKVSDGVVIGFATRLGKPIGQYFVLARE